MKHFDVLQGSKEWFVHKMGKPSASEMDKIITPLTLRPSKQAHAYLCRLVAEWYLQEPFLTETTVWTTSMERGIELEQEAILFYETTTGLTTKPAGWCELDNGTAGCSPDRFSGDEGLVEIKVPEPQTMVRYLLAGTLPDDYIIQLQAQLFVTGKKWVDFLAYGDRFPSLPLRIYPDPKAQEALRISLAQFCRQLDAAKAMLDAMRK